MALGLLARGRTACYYICINNERIPGSLDYSTVIHHIPHLRSCPRTTYTGLGRQTADIELADVIGRCSLFRNHLVTSSIFIECLHILVRTLRDHQRHPHQDPGSILCDVLEHLLLTHNHLDWSKQVKYFACFAYLFDDAVLGASTPLHKGMSNFVIRNARTIAQHAPLNISLQFVNLCSVDFLTAMTAVFDELRAADRAELISLQGMLPLYIDGRCSSTIIRYMFSRFGERVDAGHHVKIRARHRVRRRQRLGPLDRGVGLFAWPR
ncbi:hypothetical protein FQN49_003780 [Arthroderma sp. PD_2]|nr:hypothetical protein FQN49_003780 [Arthroderma sp. PD_2]